MLEPSTPLINPHDNALELVINILLKVALPEDMVITPLGLAASVILSLLLAYVPLVFTNITPAAELLLSIFTLFVVKEEFLVIINAEPWLAYALIMVRLLMVILFPLIINALAWLFASTVCPLPSRIKLSISINIPIGSSVDALNL